ncbi:MAG: Purine nucleoside phosphorylase [Candidatus Peregrinibacteria bacterium GW2011_GWA2_43_8]|nr:MAG: Purine nucleoside phosphorylase [Candidatus Peregrinibacteria bacterium GW2011_GWA2_43_8]
MNKAQIGIFGGSGFYDFLKNAKEIEMDTPYGKPSGKIVLGEYKGKKIAFMPRHGEGHKYPPHKIPYRANMWAFKELGVKFVLGPCASGSLRPEIEPGDFVICDQFIDRTKGRNDTYYEGPKVAHVEAANPYCANLGEIAAEEAQKLGIKAHQGGTVVVIEGPRFSTKAESKWFSSAGFDVINMTQYPECYFAKDLGMCYSAVASVTDYDVGVVSSTSMRPGSMDQVLKIFHRNTALTRELLARFVSNVTTLTACECARERLDEYYKASK